MTAPLPEQARDLVERSEAAGLPSRALGGAAVALRCPAAASGPLRRELHDLDLITASRTAFDLGRLLEQVGYQPEARFNALHGHTRMLFTSSEGLHLDVLVGDFQMCHKLPLRGRLTLDPLTLTLADLLLTKLQIAELNQKDATDVAAILLDHDLGAIAGGIDLPYLTGLLGNDWGWWRTVTANLDLLPSALPSELDDASRSRVLGQAEALRAAIDDQKKSLAWRMRARVGDRVPWRLDPEEV
jgi:hypothetical protein